MDLLSIGSSPSQNGTPGQGESNLSCSNCMFIFMTIVELCHTDAAESKPVHAVPEAIDLLGSLSSTTSVSG
jgi:AP-1 complex subunit gamma-1